MSLYILSIEFKFAISNERGEQKVEQHLVVSISSYISKLLRRTFGKGPQSCQTSIYINYLITYLRGFLSPIEEVLCSKVCLKQLTIPATLSLNI
ncbi:DUF2294 family protein [Bacillus sp. B15-48]|nr:DUF2294 family protein [Bacillus sp. B15-48]